MTLIVVLVILASTLVFLETVLVGGIWAVAGIGLFGWAIYEAFARFGIWPALAVAVVSAFMCVGAFLVWLYVIPKTSLGKKLYLNTAQDGHAPSENFKKLDGSDGIAITMLVPTGKVSVNGTPFDAKCITGHAEKGDKIKVVGADSFELKVRKF